MKGKKRGERKVDKNCDKGEKKLVEIEQVKEAR